MGELLSLARMARRMILTGELLSAAEAQRLGVVDTVAADDDFHVAVDARVAQLLSRSPRACREVKELIAQFEAPESERLFEAEAAAFGRCFATGEPAEGLAAFLEKRPPRWQ